MKKIYVFIMIMVLVVVVGTNIHWVKANPSLLLQGGASIATTTTSSYTTLTGISFWQGMKAGNSTTTVKIDSFTGVNQAIDSGTLLVSWSGSSTEAVLQIDPEYSMDGSTWYSDSLYVASTTRSTDLTSLNKFTLTFASSTDKTFYANGSNLGGVAGESATSTRAISVNFPTRFVRYIFTLPTNDNNADQESKNGMLRVDFVGKRQTVN
jgi:hypothetical protein